MVEAAFPGGETWRGMANYAEGYNRGVNSARAAQNGGRMQTRCTTYGNTTTCN
jgi:hypothetical protein